MRTIAFFLLLISCVWHSLCFHDSTVHAETIEKTAISEAVTSVVLAADNEIVDTAILPNGGVVYLSKKWAIWPPTERTPEPIRINLTVEQRVYLQKLFVDPKDENAFFVAGTLSSRGDAGMAMFRLSKAGFELVDFVREPVRLPTYYKAPGGEMFISSNTGVIFRFDGKKFSRFALPWPDDENFNLSKKFAPLEFISWRNGRTCCFSRANSKNGKMALFDLLVAREDGWQRIALDLPQTGPACFVAEDTVRMLLPNRWINIHLPTGKKTETEFETPRSTTERTEKDHLGNDLEPMKLVHLPDGKLVSIWKRGIEQPNQTFELEPLEGDAFHRIATWEENRWKIAPIGINRELGRPQFHEIDDAGGLWLLGGEGALVYRSPQGEWSEFRHEYGLPANSVAQMKLEPANDVLRIHYLRSNRVTEFATTKVVELESVPQLEWRVFFGKRYETLEQNGRLQPLRTLTGDIVIVGPTGVRIVAPPSDDVFQALESAIRVRLDSHESLWIYSTDLAQVAQRKENKWIRYQAKPLEGRSDLTAWETAAEQLASEGYREGDYAPGIAFGPEKQIAVIGPQGVSFFDGKLWHLARTDGFAGGQFVNVEFRREEGKPKWVAKTKSKEYALLTEKMIGQDQPTDPMLALGPAMSIKRPVLSAADSMRLKSTCPIEETRQQWIYTRREGLALAADTQQMAFYNGQRWAITSIAECPFSSLLHKKWSSEFSGAHGRWVLASRVSNYTYRYAIYDPPGVTVATAEKNLGKVSTPEAGLNPNWVATPKLNDAIFRFRIDDGIWSKWRNQGTPIYPGGVMPPGKHQLQMEVQSLTQVVNQSELTYQFDVAYDLTERIEQLVQRLGSLKFQERYEATEALLKLGPMIQNQLITLKSQQTDREIQLRLDYLIQMADQPW